MTLPFRPSFCSAFDIDCEIVKRQHSLRLLNQELDQLLVTMVEAVRPGQLDRILELKAHLVDEGYRICLLQMMRP